MSDLDFMDAKTHDELYKEYQAYCKGNPGAETFGAWYERGRLALQDTAMIHTQEKRQELVEQLEDMILRRGMNIKTVADFILENFEPKVSNSRPLTPPLNTEELEKEIVDILHTVANEVSEAAILHGTANTDVLDNALKRLLALYPASQKSQTCPTCGGKGKIWPSKEAYEFPWPGNDENRTKACPECAGNGYNLLTRKFFYLEAPIAYARSKFQTYMHVNKLGFQTGRAKGFDDFEYFGESVEPITGFSKWFLAKSMKVPTYKGGRL